MVANLQMQVRGFAFDGAPEKIVNADCHVGVSSARIRPNCDVSTRNIGGQASRAVRLRSSHLNDRTVLGVPAESWKAESFAAPKIRLFSGIASRRGIPLGILRLAGRPSKYLDSANE